MLQIQQIIEIPLHTGRIVIIGHDYRTPRTIAGDKCGTSRGCALVQVEINSFERFHLRTVARPARFASVIARHRRVIKNHGRGVNFREMEIHGKFNPVIRPASVPFDTRRGYRNLAITTLIAKWSEN